MIQDSFNVFLQCCECVVQLCVVCAAVPFREYLSSHACVSPRFRSFSFFAVIMRCVVSFIHLHNSFLLIAFITDCDPNHMIMEAIKLSLAQRLRSSQRVASSVCLLPICILFISKFVKHVCQFIYQSVYISVNMSVCLSFCLCTCPPVCPHPYLSVHLAVRLCLLTLRLVAINHPRPFYVIPLKENLQFTW